MPTIIAVANLKGGCGKTTTAANLAVALGAAGARVLATDLDGSSVALTRAFGRAPSDMPGTALEVMTGELELPAAVADVAPGVELLAARRELAALELELVATMGRETVLRRALSGHLALYDTVLIDCPPTLSLLAVNGLFAAQYVIAPVSLGDAGALQGLVELRHAITRARAAGADAELLAAVRVKADSRRIASRAIADALLELSVPVAQTEIPLAAAFDTAIADGSPVMLTQPDSRGAWAYRRLAAELELAPAARAAA